MKRQGGERERERERVLAPCRSDPFGQNGGAKCGEERRVI